MESDNDVDFKDIRSCSTEAARAGQFSAILPPADATPADSLNRMLDRASVRRASRGEEAVQPAGHSPACNGSEAGYQSGSYISEAHLSENADPTQGSADLSAHDAPLLLPGSYDITSEEGQAAVAGTSDISARQEGRAGREGPSAPYSEPPLLSVEASENKGAASYPTASLASSELPGARDVGAPVMERRKSLFSKLKNQHYIWKQTGFAHLHLVGTMRKSSTSSACNNHRSSKGRISLDTVVFNQRSKLYQLFYMFVKSEYFDYLMGILLIINALAIGVQADYMAREQADQTPIFFRVLMTFFCVVFVLEIVARLAVNGRRFFYMRGWQWNWFDMVVVIFQITDEITQAFLDGGKMPNFIENLEVLRMLRVVRVVRLVRMVRLIPELKSMVYLIAASMWSFFWTLVLLLLVMYVGAVYFTEICSDVARKNPDNPKIDEIRDRWGSIFKSVLSLYMAITGGDDWRNLTDVFSGFSYALNTFMFSIYIAFGTLVMLNLVTGVFVEGAQRIIKEDKDNELMRQVCKLFMYNDTDNSQEISWKEFEEQLHTPAMDEYFRAVELSRREAKDLFRLLDVDKSGSISIEEFVRGCLRLRGPARSVDLAFMQYHQQAMANKVNRLDSRFKDFCRREGASIASACSSCSMPQMQGYSGPHVDIHQAQAGYDSLS
mmetsp:Transcript_39985/g.74099  ORF Transcript_39985/g.74099 Transcript_39985/m.74099 type:complete len:666 (+) Transcript_39985:3-2000(+)